jgi:hypothetical protein
MRHKKTHPRAFVFAVCADKEKSPFFFDRAKGYEKSEKTRNDFPVTGENDLTCGKSQKDLFPIFLSAAICRKK